MRILIAEDDPVLAEGLMVSLRESGYSVDRVATGAEADCAIASFEFDLLILDLGLPKMSGLEVLKRLRGRSRELPVLILTAEDGVEARVRGLDLGADDYLAKPFALEELKARVRALTRRGSGGQAAARRLRRSHVRPGREGGPGPRRDRSTSRHASSCCSSSCCSAPIAW